MRLVFVSSTFKDMQFERDELNIRLAPRVNDFLLKYGESVRFGDLRWGVNTSEMESEESSKKVLRVCLDEIDNAKPYMIVFIGERYGWIPSSSLLHEAMKMKDIENVPDDISVTNLEIEYGALLSPDYEGRVLFYFRNPFDMSKMDEEQRKIYEAESPLHKKKLEALKKRILELYPDYVRYYDVVYDEEKKCLSGLDALMEQIYADLTRIFDIDYQYLNSLPPYKRAIMNSEVYFSSLSKYAYCRDNLADSFDPESELKENYADGRYSDIPCLRYVLGEPGSGRKTALACLYEEAKQKSEYVLPFVFGLDEFTSGKDALISVLVSFYEEKLNYRHFKIKNIYTLADLIRYNATHDKHHFQIFILNHHKDVIILLKELEFMLEEMLYTTFYVMGDSQSKEYSPYLAFGFHSDPINLGELEEQEKVAIIQKICESRRKELSLPVIEAILEKENSGSPLYLSLVVERLLMLSSEDFQKIRELGDGMEAINAYMLSLVDSLGEDTISIAEELFKELAKRINEEQVMHILYLAAKGCTLRLDEYRDFFAYCGLPYSELDLSLLYNTIPSLFMPISIHNALEFAFDAAKVAAKEVSEAYVEENFYQRYIDYLDDSDASLFKKLSLYREIGDVPAFFEIYSRLLRKHPLESEARLFENGFISYMNAIDELFRKVDDSFFDEFLLLAVSSIVEKNNPDRDTLLSVIFYPFALNLVTEEEQTRCVRGIHRIIQYLLSVMEKESCADSTSLHLVCGVAYSFVLGIRDGLYYNGLSEDEFDQYSEDVCAFWEIYDPENYRKALGSSSMRTGYHTAFLYRANLMDAVSNIPYAERILDHEGSYSNFIASNLEWEKLCDCLENDDFQSWINEMLIFSVIALFYDLLLVKHKGKPEEYVTKLNNYLKVADLLLQNDFFDINRSTMFERSLLEPLFRSFAILVGQEEVDETISYSLSDWLLIRSRESCARDPANRSFIFVYATVLRERGPGNIPDKDFFFLYPLMYKSLQNSFDQELWFMAFALLEYTTALYKDETDLEYLFLVYILYLRTGNMLLVHQSLAHLLKMKGRNPMEDDLISQTYAFITDDEGFEDKKAFEMWLNDYLNCV